VSGLSTHVLDTGSGRPAAAVPVVLSRRDGGDWAELGRGETDEDGRLVLLADGLTTGTHRLTFDTGTWFAATDRTGFYPEVAVAFDVTDLSRHHHVPLLLSPYGYSTYRGS
jgi:5-hydroxyisourate hydrolase